MKSEALSDKPVKLEVARVMAAFGGDIARDAVQITPVSAPTIEAIYCYRAPQFTLKWAQARGSGVLVSMAISSPVEDLVGCRFFRRVAQWTMEVHRRETAHFMARGLYSLGFEDKTVFAELPELTAHEKLELRLSMPREFWPQRWLDEEGK